MRSIQSGVTLVELLVAVALVAALGALGAPALAEYQQGARLAAASGELVADLQRARAEALQRNGRVTLCKSPDGLQCTTRGGWEQGWIVFHDENGNRSVDEGEEVLARRAALEGQLRVVGNQPVASYVTYTAVGASKLVGGGFQAGTVTVCRQSEGPVPARQVILNAIGRPRVQKATVASCR